MLYATFDRGIKQSGNLRQCSKCGEVRTYISENALEDLLLRCDSFKAKLPPCVPTSSFPNYKELTTCDCGNSHKNFVKIVGVNTKKEMRPILGANYGV